MALNRGRRTVTLPIAGDVARYGKAGAGESTLSTFGNIGKAIVEEIQSNQIKDFEIAETTHNNYLQNIKLEKDKEKLYKDQLAAINKAKFNNAINLVTSRINIDVSNAITKFQIENKNPVDFLDNIKSWTNGYIKDNDLKPFVTPEGEVKFDPKTYILESITSSSNTIYKTLYNDQIKTSAKNSYDLFNNDLDIIFGNGFSNFSKIIEGLDSSTQDTFLDDLTLAFQPVYKGYTEYVGKLENLKTMYPNIYTADDFVESNANKYQQILTEQVVGQVAKLYLSGATDKETLDIGENEAKKFIQDWYNNNINENTDLISEKLVYEFTKNAKDFDLDTRENIKTKALSLLDERYKFLEQEITLQNSQIKSGNKLAIKNLITAANNINMGEIPDAYVREQFTTYTKDKGSQLDEVEYLNFKSIEKRKLDLNNSIIQLTDNESGIDFLEVVNDPRYKDLTRDQIAESVYEKLNQEEVNVNDFVNKINRAALEGFDLANDTTFQAISYGLTITNQYPKAFTDYAESLTLEDFNDQSTQNKLYNFLSALNTFNGIEEYNLNPTFVEAANFALQYINKPNPDETDIVKMTKAFGRYFSETKDSIEDIEEAFITEGQIFLPSYFNKQIYAKSPFGSPDSSVFKNIEKNSSLYKSVPNTLFTTVSGNLVDALKANQSIINTKIINEAVREASKRDISYLGEDKKEGREDLLITATKNTMQSLNDEGWRFDGVMYNNDDPQGNYPVLTPYSILLHSKINNIEDLKNETNHQLRMIFNAMSPEEKIDFFGTENWQEEYIDNLDEMFDNGQIKFKVDDRSILTDELRWFIMMDKEGQYKNWEELEVFDPNGDKVSWNPVNTVYPTSKASFDYVKNQMKNKIKNQLLETYSPAYREEGKILAFDEEVFGTMANLAILALDNYKEFEDKFSDFKDFDTIKELKNRNQAEYAVEKQNYKTNYEVPSQDYVINEFSARIQQFDLPMSPMKEGKYFVYKNTQTDNNLNKNEYIAIGPGLPIEINGKINPDIKKILEDNNYSEKDLRNIITGEMGIDRDTYEQLGVYKYKTATAAYEEIYDEVLLSPRHRNVLIDIIASVGVDLVGPNSNIYKYIHAGNMNLVYNELINLKEFYNNKKRHTAHLSNWGFGG